MLPTPYWPPKYLPLDGIPSRHPPNHRLGELLPGQKRYAVESMYMSNHANQALQRLLFTLAPL